MKMYTNTHEKTNLKNTHLDSKHVNYKTFTDLKTQKSGENSVSKILIEYSTSIDYSSRIMEIKIKLFRYEKCVIFITISCDFLSCACKKQ